MHDTKVYSEVMFVETVQKQCDPHEDMVEISIDMVRSWVGDAPYKYMTAEEIAERALFTTSLCLQIPISDLMRDDVVAEAFMCGWRITNGKYLRHAH